MNTTEAHQVAVIMVIFNGDHDNFIGNAIQCLHSIMHLASGFHFARQFVLL